MFISIYNNLYPFGHLGRLVLDCAYSNFYLLALQGILVVCLLAFLFRDKVFNIYKKKYSLRKCRL